MRKAKETYTWTLEYSFVTWMDIKKWNWVISKDGVVVKRDWHVSKRAARRDLKTAIRRLKVPEKAETGEFKA